ncbi:YigZ family protein [Desulfogranum mediterraneum]|uniref:YigZ family protein n=1 Tax=Desulfogranum mediterraneum TaxID=160661 RepID=UPI00048CF5D6|nr:YigZ family protein [Desulfogranum mediterraneum]
MSERYLIPALAGSEIHRVEETIKRSRFITTIAHSPDPEGARAFIARLKEEFGDANHNCWAFQCGPPGDTSQVGMSDDGEPHNTAGKPMLNMLLHAKVGELACVVSRYFGGIKLGSGGLVRAYSGMVRLGLEELATREKVALIDLQLIMAYAHISPFKRLLAEFEAEIIAEEFAADAGFTLRLPQEQLTKLEERLTDLTRGEILIEPIA